MIGWLLARLPPRVPARFVLTDGRYFLDGGTTGLHGTDERGRSRSLCLTQQIFPRMSWWDPLVGRLYVGGRLVPLGGEAERAVLALLEAAVAEARARPPEVPDERPAGSVGPVGAGPRAILFGSDDLREYHVLSTRRERLIWLAERVIEYVRSDDAGREPEAPEP